MEPGSLIADRYRLDDSIASGGMGTVWRAFDTRLKRAVAVKIVNYLGLMSGACHSCPSLAAACRRH